MFNSSTPASSMQKTYDDCYLTCSTAIYFEKQGDETEALRNWKSALDQIYYHNAYKIPASYRPKTETEKALQDSLRDLELQCKERVDLLDAIQKSRKANKSKSNIVQRIVSGGSTASQDSTIASGSVPTYEYDTLPRPQLPTVPFAIRPKPVTTASSTSIRDRVTPQMLEEAQREADKKNAIAAAANMPPPFTTRPSRSPSPDKKSGFFKSTLRASKDSRLANTMRGGKPAHAPAAAAASVVWPGANSGETPGHRTSSSISRQPSVEPVANMGRHVSSPNEDVRRTMSMDLPSRSRTHEPTMREFGGPRGSAVDTLIRRSQDLGARPTNMGPPPRPQQQQINTNVGSSRQTSSSSNPVSPPLPQLQYRNEYTDGSLDQRNQQMLKSRKARMELDAIKAAAAAQPPQEQPQSPSKFRQAFRMPQRKAVGSGPSPQPQAPAVYAKPPASRQPQPVQKQEQMPPPSSAKNTVAAQQAKKVVRAKPSIAAAMPPTGLAPPPKIKERVLAGTPPPPQADSSGDEGDANSPDWDKRVKYILKHLPKGVDEQAAKSILNEIVVKGDEVHWEDIAGLDIAKNALKEAVVYPFLRPDLFMGLREPARGMLLFGPPGTGKTMLARAVATESKSTFFAISASSLTSKYMGESEKLVRALFTLAKVLTPAIIFVDEIDSLLSSRSGSGEHEATRRIKTEFLIQWSDLASAAAGNQKTDGDPSRVLVLAATNLPWAIDEAARRRFVRRQYIPLPESHVRESQLVKLMAHQRHGLRERDFKRLVVLTDGFSGSDITALAKDAAMGPLRALGERLLHMRPEDIRPISLQDFEASLVTIRPSVSKQGLQEFEDWAKEFGERGG